MPMQQHEYLRAQSLEQQITKLREDFDRYIKYLQDAPYGSNMTYIKQAAIEGARSKYIQERADLQKQLDELFEE